MAVRMATVKKWIEAKPGAVAVPYSARKGSSPVSVMYKVANRIFAILALRGDQSVILKCDPHLIPMLREQYSGVGHRSHLDRRLWINVALDADVPAKESSGGSRCPTIWSARQADRKGESALPGRWAQGLVRSSSCLPARRTGADRAEHRVPGAAASCSWCPRWTMRPSCTTRIWSASSTVESRCAITMRCGRRGRSRACCMAASDPNPDARWLRPEPPDRAISAAAGDGKALLLAAGETIAPLAHQRIEALRERIHERRRIWASRSASRISRSVASGLGVKQVCANRVVKEVGVLGDHSHSLLQ